MTPQSKERAEDPEFDPEKITEAAEDLQTKVGAPEVSDETEELTTWDEAPASLGREIPKVPLEDETPVGETLTYEGVDEADREQRIAAEDPDYEP